MGERARFVRGPLAVQLVDEALQPGAGQSRDAGDGPDRHALAQQPQDQRLALLADRALAGGLDEAAAAALAEEARLAGAGSTVADDVAGAAAGARREGEFGVFVIQPPVL